MLKDDGWDTSTARRLASWDPYDHNASAEFFDPEWMFGLVGGFDVVIGNPPYRRELGARELLDGLRVDARDVPGPYDAESMRHHLPPSGRAAGSASPPCTT